MNDHDWFDPACEHVEVVLISGETLRKAEQQIISCESCAPSFANLPFECVLDRLTACDPLSTNYLLVEGGRCPRCGELVFEHTLICSGSPAGSSDDEVSEPLLAALSILFSL
jgi:hypothetical protein